ncbi:MAG: lipopolysaccharide biosynthesis protein [Halioglobus sp.]
MDLSQKVMSALRWSAAARFFGQLFSWGITIFVIRLLDPQDYGLMAMAMVLVSGLILLNTWGLDAVLVQTETVSEYLRQQIFGAVIVFNLFIFAALQLLSPALAGWYGEPSLEPVLRLLSVQFLLLIFETLPQSALEREIEFAHRSVVDFVTLVIASLTTLALALLGYGVWALAWGAVVGNASRVIGLNLIIRNLVWPRFSFSGMREHFAFGGFVSADRGLWFLFSESDKFIGGKMLGSQALGYYSVASQLASMPIHKMTGLLNAVAFPAFSQAHANTSNAQVQDYLLKASRLLSIAAIPVFFGMSCTAPLFVNVLLGDKWAPAAPLLQLLALVMPLRLLGNIFPPLLWGTGQPRVSASNFALASVFMVAAFLFGSQWGVIGLAYAWVFMFPLVFMVTAHRSCRAIHLPIGRYLKQLWRPAIAGLAMYAAVLAANPIVVTAFGPVGELAQLVSVGAAVYLIALWLLDRQSMVETISLLRK